MKENEGKSICRPHTHPEVKKKRLAGATALAAFLDSYCAYKAGEEAKDNWPQDYCCNK